MPNAAIVAKGISKLYRIGERRASYRTFRETLAGLAGAPFRRLRASRGREKAASAAEATIWALRDVSFEVSTGEVLGVIGRNGAGKSTLLKVLSRITEPTDGRATIRGRVGSLLEVGTGFHPELTGRENVFLNGAILGMSRREIGSKLEQIVEFAEISQFIETPVKHYSSGMYLRLAFSVAAHMETEILLVDEVLAVGDLRFQKRCLGKMESVAAEGRTVIFVSHNLGVVKELCQTALVLEDGAVAFRGPVVEGVAHYTRVLGDGEGQAMRGTRWSGVSIVAEGSGPGGPVLSAQPFHVEATLDVQRDLRRVRLYCLVEDSSGQGIVHNVVTEQALAPAGLQGGRYQIRVEVPPLWLIPDVYTLYFKLIGRRSSGEEERCLSERVILNVSDRSGQSAGKVRATLIPLLEWRMRSADPEIAEAHTGAERTDAK